VTNASALLESDENLVSTNDVVYSISIKLLSVAMQATRLDSDRIELSLANLGASLREPMLETSVGTLKSHRGDFLRSGLPNQFAIDVPADASALILQARSTQPTNDPVDLYLYDCTSGECFNYDFTVIPAKGHEFVVPRPKPGRWVATVDASVFPRASGSFVLDEIITKRSTELSARQILGNHVGAAGEQSTIVQLPDPAAIHRTAEAGEPVLVCELVDDAVQRDGTAHPWENRPGVVNFAERTVAIGRTIIRLN
jgi:hypothetical protein